MKNPIFERFGIKYPFIQAPMFGVSTPEMVAAAAEAHCLGSLALGDMPADYCRAQLAAVRKLTDKPFAVNIFTHSIPEVTAALRADYRSVSGFLQTIAVEHNLTVDFPDIDDLQLPSYHEQVDVLIEEACPIVSFTFGNLDAESIQKLKAAGTLLIGTCTSVEEALLLEQAGIPVICVQGIEAGGHRGSFLGNELPQIGGLSLLAQVYDKVHVPLIYAGGLYNNRTVAAAASLGAQAFQVGSLLVNATESALQPFEKSRLQAIKESDIRLLRSFSGRYARGIKNTFTELLEDSSYILPYPYQNKLTGALRKAAKAQKNVELLNLWHGQSIPNYDERSTKTILGELIKNFDL